MSPCSMWKLALQQVGGLHLLLWPSDVLAYGELFHSSADGYWLFPLWGYHEYRYYEYFCTRFCVDIRFHFFGVDTYVAHDSF